jgi:hypothetical protein
MKYLKKYKLFESKEDIIQTVKDILLPLSDLDYTISFTQNNLYRGDFNIDSLIGYEFIIRIVRYTDKPLVVTDEIKEDFITMNDYLESEGFSSIEAHYVRGDAQVKREFDDFIKNAGINLPTSDYKGDDLNSYRNLLFTAKKIESE